METEILIVGGGLSGLALADHLTQRGVEFRLIEAQSRLGGRILTKTLSGGAFDVGPAWFWPGQPRMASLVHRFQIPVFEQNASGDQIYEDQSGALRRVRGFASMPVSYRLAGGMGAMVDALSNTIDTNRLCLDTRLVAVEPTSQGYSAECDQGGSPVTIHAKQVVLAIPPRVLADTVSLDRVKGADDSRALKEVPTWMAGQAKIAAVYDEPYWRQGGYSGDVMSHHGPMFEIHDASPMHGGPFALFGFVGVPPEIRKHHPDAIRQEARAQLARLFGPKMATPLDLVLQDWAAVPEIARPLDQAPLAHHPAYGQLASQPSLAQQGLHLASTETADGFGGYLEGALEAAARTDRAISRSVQTAT